MRNNWLKYYGYKSHTMCFQEHGWKHEYLPMEEALTRKYIRANPKSKTTMVVIDYDKTDFWDALKTGHIPTPNLVVENPDSGHCHLWYYLKNPVKMTDSQTSAAEQFLLGVARRLRGLVAGDPNFTDTFIRNPWYPELKVRELKDSPYALMELAEYANRYEPKSIIDKKLTTSRNLSMFELLSREARRLRVIGLEGEELKEELTKYANETNKNSELGTLNAGELKSTLKSVYNWAENKFDVEKYIENKKLKAEIRWNKKTITIPGRENVKLSSRDVSQLILKMYERGDKLQDIADSLGLTYLSVAARLRYLRETGRSVIRGEVSSHDVVDLYMQGKSAKEISKELKMGLSTVYAKLKKTRERV